MRLHEVSLGIVIGMLVVTLFITTKTDAAVERIEKTVVSYEYTEPEPFMEMVERDENRIFEEYIAQIEQKVEIKTPPYDDINLDADYQEFLYGRCIAHQVDFWLALALMESESSFNEEAVGDSGNSVGLMQINKCWWDEFEELDEKNPYDNIEIGLYILEDLLTRYDEVTAIHMYKCGEYRGLELMKKGIIIEGAQNVIERATEMEKSHPQHEADGWLDQHTQGV